MASVRVFSSAIIGLDAVQIEVEVDATPGLHSFTIVGLPDKSVEESKDRIAAAIRNSGFKGPKQKSNRIIVNLAPADIRKEGPAFDLPIALGYLAASKQLVLPEKKSIILGELSLNGNIRPVSGVLATAVMAKSKKATEVIVPAENADEASVVKGINVIPVKCLADVIGHLRGQSPITPLPSFDYKNHLVLEGQEEYDTDLSDIRGQENAKRALLIAASGGHNLMMSGPPGTGKTLLAKAMPSIMPPLTLEEAIEVTKIYSVAGMTIGKKLTTTRPFRNPHHTTSAVAVVGGGSWPKPGEVSLAHRGVLFLDELPEFSRGVIESLRQPLENGSVTVSRAATSVTFPSRFLLVAAMNPCPCGNYGNEQIACICTPSSLNNYQKKVSGPLLDRIDLQVIYSHGTGLKFQTKSSVTSSHVREKVLQARAVQEERFKGQKIFTNAEMSPRTIEKFCPLNDDCMNLMRTAMDKYSLSGRGYHKVQKVARTIADLDGKRNIDMNHLAESLTYRIQQENEA